MSGHNLTVDEVLSRALGPVLHDLRGAGIGAPKFKDYGSSDEESSSINLVSPDGSESNLRVHYSGSESDRVVEAADQVQDWAVAELWPGSPTNWPPCPHHPAGHPLRASIAVGVAVWTCPADGTPFGSVGSL